MFNKIQNPETGKWVNTNGPVGKRVLRNYVRQMGGFSFPFASKNPPTEDKLEKLKAKLNQLVIEENDLGAEVNDNPQDGVPYAKESQLERITNDRERVDEQIKNLETELEAKKAKQEAKLEAKKAKQEAKKAKLEAKKAKLEAKIVQERKLVVDANNKAKEAIENARKYTPIGSAQLRFGEMLRFPSKAWKNPAEMKKEDGLLRDNTDWLPVDIQAHNQRAATKRIDRINKEIQKLQTRLSELIPAANAGQVETIPTVIN